MTDKSPHVQGDILRGLDREVLTKESVPLKAAVITNEAEKIAVLIRDGAYPNESTSADPPTSRVARIQGNDPCGLDCQENWLL